MGFSGKKRGSALVITLIVIVVLSVIVSAFLTSMSIERLTSQSYADVLRAELAAEAGFSEALGRMTGADLTFPVTAYEEYPTAAGGTAPALVMLKPNATWDDVAERRYLVGSQAGTLPPGTEPATDLPTDFATDMNAVVDNDPDGWIGLRDASGARREVPAEWIYLRDTAGEVVGRYTYWVDDESARIDMSSAGGSESDGSHRRVDGSDPAEVAVHGLFDTNDSAAAFLSFRGGLGPSWRGLYGYRQAPSDAAWSEPVEMLKAAMGWGAKADERGALGVRKLNVNDWVAKSADFSTPPKRDELAQKVIALGKFIDQADPTFGKRFYNGVPDTEKEQYAIKIAANLQDYIDTDSQPTVIRNGLGGWQEPPDPTQDGAGAPDAPPAVFGKEVVPAIGEYVGYYYPDSGSLRIDHTFEVWNLHTTPIDLSKLGDVKILMAERNELSPYSTDTTPAQGGPAPAIVGLPSELPLVLPVPKSGMISSGGYALLTTLPAGSPYDDRWVVNSPQRIRLQRGEPLYPYITGGLQMAGDQESTLADADTEILVTNQYGYLDIEPRVAQQGKVVLEKDNVKNVRLVASQSFGNAPPTSGNLLRRYPLDSGDPRSFTDVYPSYSEGGDAASSIAWRRNTGTGSITAPAATRLGGESYSSGGSGPTSGIIPNNSLSSSAYYVPEPTPFLDPDASDSSPANDPSPTTAVSVIRDGPMRTIGELGFLYDPAINGTGMQATDVRKRGGFRTLSIGSKMGEKTGPSRLDHVNETSRASRLLELFTAGKKRPGILLNSVLRDPANRPWHALLRGLKTQDNDAPTTIFPAPRDPNFQGNALAVNADAFVQALEARANGGGVPFLLTGQLADLDIFNTGNTLFKSGFAITPTARNKELMDRGREEVFRDLAGLLTLKGSVFRVHVIGQGGRIGTDGQFIVRGVRRALRLYELERQYPQADPLEETAMPALLENNQPTAVRARQLAEIQL